MKKDDGMKKDEAMAKDKMEQVARLAAGLVHPRARPRRILFGRRLVRCHGRLEMTAETLTAMPAERQFIPAGCA